MEQIPNTLFSLLQALGQAGSQYHTAKLAAQDRNIALQDRQRGQDIQNLQVWQQLLPGLTQYSPQTEVPAGMPGMSMLAGGEIPAQFKTPDAPEPIKQSLIRLTGQPTIGLSPEAKNNITESFIRQSTAGDAIKIPGLQRRNAELDVNNKAIESQGTQSKVQDDWLSRQAPGFVAAAAQRLGRYPTMKDAPQVIDWSYQQFLAANSKQALAQGITKEKFAALVMPLIQQGIENQLQQEQLANQRRQIDATAARAGNDVYSNQFRALDSYVDNLRGQMQEIMNNPASKMILMIAQNGGQLSAEQKVVYDKYNSLRGQLTAAEEAQAATANQRAGQYGMPTIPTQAKAATTGPNPKNVQRIMEAFRGIKESNPGMYRTAKTFVQMNPTRFGQDVTAEDVAEAIRQLDEAK